MVVRFTQEFVPIDNPPFLPNDAERCFSSITLDMARRLIDSAATNPRNDMQRVLDMRHLLHLMEWCSSLPTTGGTVPYFFESVSRARNSTFHLFHELLARCHVCLKTKPLCMCAATGREVVAAILRRDWELLDSILDHHRRLCRRLEHTSTAQSLVMLERASIPAWTNAINSELFQCLFVYKSLDRIPGYVNTAVAQMNAYLALSTMQPPRGNGDGRGLPVLARLQALDMADVDKKDQIQLLLLSYLNNVHRDRDGDSATLCWVPQPDLLHGVLRAIETYERGMQCTLLALAVAKVFQEDPQQKADQVASVMHVVAPTLLLALGVAKVFQQDQQLKVNTIMCLVATSVLLAVPNAFQHDQQRKASQANNAMRIVVEQVHPFLGPPRKDDEHQDDEHQDDEPQYDEDYLLEWFNMSS